jgi:hypothetical protein
VDKDPARLVQSETRRRAGGSWELIWDEDGQAGVEVRREVLRQDRLVSRQRWQFGQRRELQGPLKVKE